MPNPESPAPGLSMVSSGPHHDWSWKTQRVDGVAYVCVEYAERCINEFGVQMTLSRLPGTRWLPVPEQGGEEWLYVPQPAVQARLTHVAQRWVAASAALAQPRPAPADADAEEWEELRGALRDALEEFERHPSGHWVQREEGADLHAVAVALEAAALWLPAPAPTPASGAAAEVLLRVAEYVEAEIAEPPRAPETARLEDARAALLGLEPVTIRTLAQALATAPAQAEAEGAEPTEGVLDSVRGLLMWYGSGADKTVKSLLLHARYSDYPVVIQDVLRDLPATAHVTKATFAYILWRTMQAATA